MSDLLDDKGSFISLEKLQKNYKIKTNFLTYASLQMSIKKNLTTYRIEMEKNNPKPIIPHNIKIFCTSKKRTKHIYNTLIADTIIPLGKRKWEKHFEISDSQWKNIYSHPFQYTKSSKLQWLQFRINNHILTTNSFLFKIRKVYTKLCCLCKESEETIIHLLWECQKVQDLLESIVSLCHSKGITIRLEKKSFIFGLNDSKEINIIFLIIKSYVYRKRCRQESLSIQELLNDCKTHVNTLKYTANQQCKYNEFINQWNSWLFLLDSP